MSATETSFWRRCLRIGVEHPKVGLALVCVVSALAAFGASRLSLETDRQAFMLSDAPERQAYLQIAREFRADHPAFVYVHDEEMWTPPKLQALAQLHDELRQLPFVARIDDVFTSPAVRSSDGQIGTQPLLAAVPADDQAAENARATVLDNPLARRMLVSDDGKSLAIALSLRADAAGGATQLAAAIEPALAHARGRLAVVEPFGDARVEAALGAGMRHDLALLGPAFAAVLIGATLAIRRNVAAAVMTSAVGVLGALWTFGAMGLLGIPANVLFVLLPPLALAFGAIEIVRLASMRAGGTSDAQSQEAMRPRGDVAAIDDMVRRFGGSAALAVLVLALGFGTLSGTGIEAVRAFGLAAAVAVLANGIVIVLLLPLLQRALKAPRQRRPVAALRALSGPAVRAVALMRSRLALLGLVVCGLAAAAFVAKAPRLPFHHDTAAFLRADSPPAATAARLHAELAGPQLIHVVLDANSEGAFRDPANLERLAQIQAFIAKQSAFDGSRSLADLLAQANMEAAGGRAAAYQVPATRKLVGEYLLLYRPSELAPYVSHDFRRADIVVRHHAADRFELARQVRELRLAVAHDAGPAMTTAVVGEGLLLGEAAERLFKGQAAALVAMAAVALIGLSLMFTSAKAGPIALVPALLPVLATLGAMRALSLPFDGATGALIVLVVGVSVQGIGHLFARYCELCRHAADYDAAVLEAVKSEAAPQIAVGLVLAASFGVLQWSAFEPVARFGLLAGAALPATIAANMLVAPLVLARVRLVGLYEILAMSMPGAALEASPLFRGLSSYQIRKTILISELRDYRDGEDVIKQGTMGRSMYLIVRGSAEVVREDADGAQRLAELSPGDVFGEIGFVHPTYRTANVRARGPVSVLRFDHDRLRKDLALFPHLMATLNFNISGILGKRLAELVEQKK